MYEMVREAKIRRKEVGEEKGGNFKTL